MIFSCTKKVRDKLSKYYPVEEAKVEIGRYNWYVDLLVLDRKNYFLFTHAETLFSFFVYMGTKRELQQLEVRFTKRLSEQLKQSIPQSLPQLDKLLTSTPTRFVKTDSRSILGSMRQLKLMILAHLNYGNRSLATGYDAINYHLNQMVMFTIELNYPDRQMAQLLREEA